MRWLIAVLGMLMACGAARADVARPDFAPRPGAQIDLTTPLVDGHGTARALSGWTSGRPAVVVFGYHNCPNLCGVEQQVVARALSRTGLSPSNYAPLFITLAPEEGAADAAAAKERLADAVGEATAAPWTFLAGPSVTALAASFGIGAIERERIRQYVHPVAVVTLTADGRISHVLPGLDVSPNDLRLALVEASAGRLGTFVDRIVLFCAGFDPTSGRYTPAIFAGLRIACLGTLAAALVGLAWLKLRERRRWEG